VLRHDLARFVLDFYPVDLGRRVIIRHPHLRYCLIFSLELLSFVYLVALCNSEHPVGIWRTHSSDRQLLFFYTRITSSTLPPIRAWQNRKITFTFVRVKVTEGLLFDQFLTGR
jgi:hypothetical protein